MVNALLIAFIAYTLMFSLLWHNKSSRDSDPEVLKTTRGQAKPGSTLARLSKKHLRARSMHDWLKG